MKQLTIEDVKSCIGFKKGTIIYNALLELCQLWYDQAKALELSDNDAAGVALDKLGKLLLSAKQ